MTGGTSSERSTGLKRHFRAYDEAIRLNPDFSFAWYHKGLVLSQLNRFEEALQSV